MSDTEVLTLAIWCFLLLVCLLMVAHMLDRMVWAIREARWEKRRRKVLDSFREFDR